MKTFLFGTLIGAVIVLIISHYQCSNPTKIEYVDRIKTDTLFVRIPEPKVIYKTKKEIFTEIDSVVIIKYLVQLDSFIRNDTIDRQIPLHVYKDSVIQNDVRLDYEIETLGFLIRFDPIITTKFKERVCRKENFSLQFGVSNRLNWKAGGGYKGWLIDAEFNGNGSFNEIYLTKQFKF